MKGKPGYTFPILFHPSINTYLVTKIKCLPCGGLNPACPQGAIHSTELSWLMKTEEDTITNFQVVLTGIRQNAELDVVIGISKPFSIQCWCQIHN
jgi:Fe-S-cluster-containing hydrogenase component 2